MGDVHQPLHCGYGYDRGGNSVKVNYFGSPTELHEVWDSSMIYTYLQPSNGDWYTLYQYLASDLQSNPSKVQQFQSTSDVVAWANESIGYVISNCYDYGSSKVSFNKAGEPQLGQWYYNNNWPVVTARLEAAGVRLAALLNKVFGDFDVNTKQLPAHFHASLEHIKQQREQVMRLRGRKA